jgi:hypothetical protein
MRSRKAKVVGSAEPRPAPTKAKFLQHFARECKLVEEAERANRKAGYFGVIKQLEVCELTAQRRIAWSMKTWQQRTPEECKLRIISCSQYNSQVEAGEEVYFQQLLNEKFK